MAKAAHTAGLTAQTLIAARALIAKPENFTRKAWARDEYGHDPEDSGLPVAAYDPWGAVFTAALTLKANARLALDALDREVNRRIGPRNLNNLFAATGIVRFADDLANSHSEVLSIFDAAIAKAEGA